MSQLRIIDPTHYSQWDQSILSTSKCSFFHSSSWARVLSESYGYKPIYFTYFDDGRLLSLIPIMGIESAITGRRGVSLPFSDHCEAIIGKEGDFHDLFNNIIDYGKRIGWKHVELRGGNQFLDSRVHSSYYYTHTLDLTPTEDKIYSGFRDSARRNIKKAIREGVKVDLCYSLDSMREFYRLNCMTRKHHGLPPQPFLFFKKVFHHIILRDQGIVVLASYNGKIIAGAIFFHFGDSAIFKYGASDKRFQLLRANNLVLWKAIGWYSRKGLRSFSFGRTEPENEGLRQFKTGFCSSEEVIKYYRYDLSLETFLTERSEERKWFAKMFRRMPIPVLKIIGSILYKHVG